MSKHVSLLTDPESWTGPPLGGDAPVRLLVAGGCHVGGFPAGEQFGFVRLAIERLGRAWPRRCFEVRTLLHVSLTSRERILVACRDYRPEILVLQLGHYESSLPLAKRLARLLRAQPAGQHSRDVSSWRPDYEPNPTLHFVETRQRRLKSAVKLAVDALLRLLGRPAFNPAKLQQLASDIFAQARTAGVPHVVVLSPFPAIDATIRRYRRELRDLLLLEAARQGCHFLDCSSLAFGITGELFADDRHLAREGHRRLSLLLAEKIGPMLAPDVTQLQTFSSPPPLHTALVERARQRMPALQP